MAERTNVLLCRESLRQTLDSMLRRGVTPAEAMTALASLLQEMLSTRPAREVPYSGPLEYIMRGVQIALEDGAPLERRDYVIRNITQGRNYLETQSKRVREDQRQAN